MHKVKLIAPYLTLALMLVGLGLAAAQDDTPISIIFMHHSTGANLIEFGNVRPALSALGYAFWDHDYNDPGLRDPDGNYTGTNWDTSDDNMPSDWNEVFGQEVTDPPSNVLSHMLQYDVIIFKSCFPASAIDSDEQLEEYREYFSNIRDVIDEHPDKLFIAFTTPPLVPNETTPEAAARARQWAEYLSSDEFLEGHPNLVIFDFFNLMADEDGYLRAEYRYDEWDSHPNEYANGIAGPIFVEFIDAAIQDFTPGDAPPPPSPSDADDTDDDVDAEDTDAEDTDAEDTDADDTDADDEEWGLPPAQDGVIDDFEGNDFADFWWAYVDDDGTLDCEVVEPGYDYDYGLQVTIDLDVDVYGGCGRDVNAEGWEEAEGLQFYLRSDTPGLPLNVVLAIDDTPFEAYVEAPGEEWELVTLTWDMFEKAEWVGDDVPDGFDPADVVAIDFVMGHWDNAVKGTIWIDAIQLIDDDDTSQSPAVPATTATFDKFALWTEGTQLRGANIWQRVVVPELDGPDFWAAAM